MQRGEDKIEVLACLLCGKGICIPVNILAMEHAPRKVIKKCVHRDSVLCENRDASKNKNDGKEMRAGSPERKHLHVMKPHGRYIQNLTIDQLAHKRLTLL